jgi:hypothetical protein
VDVISNIGIYFFFNSLVILYSIRNYLSFSLQVYWSRVFLLPKKIILMIEQKLNRFLWCGQDSKA